LSRFNFLENANECHTSYRCRGSTRRYRFRFREQTGFVDPAANFAPTETRAQAIAELKQAQAEVLTSSVAR
jgi:hypothetical protein